MFLPPIYHFRGFERLEPDAGKLARPVLRGGGLSNGTSLPDQVYGPYTTNSYDLDPEQVTGFLLDKGLEREAVWNILSLSKDSLEKGLMKAGFKGRRKRERDGLMRDILAMAPIVEEENIGFRKIKAENQPVEQAEAA